MAIRVLGPLETGNGQALSPRERIVLAALIVRAGRTVAPDQLAEACWGEDPPRTWAQQVKTTVARIRAGLGSSSVVTRGSEYMLGLDPATIDAFEFERLVSIARRHALHDEHDRAVDAYRRSLALWRGPAYVELTDWEPAAVEAERLAEIRASAEEELLESRLAEGEHRAVIADAERLVRESPLRENRWAILATANYRAGRQAEALASLRAARSRMADELGIDIGERLQSLEGAMLRQDPSLTAVKTLHRVSDLCPYRGLQPYSPTDADEFFGREADVEAIRQRARPGALVAVVGASGSGKSSLVLAGVLPHVGDGRRVAVVTAGRDATLALRARVEHRGAAEVVVIDQAEAVFQLEERERDALCALVADVLAAGSIVLMTLRSDFLDRATGLPRIGAAIGGGVYAIGPLSEAGLREAIERPAARAGLRLEPGLAELIVRDAGDRRTTLPHVSHVLVETWLRREGAAMTVAGYEASGGIAGAIAQSAESLYQALDPSDADGCRALMLRLVHRGADGASVRRSASFAPFVADPDRRRLLDRLVAARLLTIDGDQVAVAHEAVATAWPRLDGWLEEDAEGARLVSAVATAAEVWDAGGRRDEDLWRGARLQATTEWDEASHPDLTEVERDFLTAASAREADERRLLAERAAREARNNRLLRWALGGAGVLLVAAMVSGGLAVVRGQDATAAAADALIEATTSTSTSILDTNREVAALLAVEAHRRWPDDARTARALMAVMTGAGGLVQSARIPDSEWRIGAWPIPGSDEVAVVRDYTHLEIHDARTGALVRSIAELPDQDHLFRPWVRVSADGSTIAVAQHAWEADPSAMDADPGIDRDEIVHFFDIATGARIGEAVRADDIAPQISLAADGSMLTWASAGRLVVIDRDTRRVRVSEATRPARPVPPDQSLAESAFSPAGPIVATNRDEAGVVVDPQTLEVISRFEVAPGSGGSGVEASSDGLVVSVGPEALSATLPGEPSVWAVPLPPTGCTRLAVASTHRRVFCGDEVGAIRAWDLDTGVQVGDVWSYLQGGAGDLAFSDDQSELLLMSAIAPGIARVRIDGSGPASTLIGTPEQVLSWGFDPTGRYVVLADGASLAPEVDQPLYEVWDARAGERVLRIPEDLDLPTGTIVVDPRWIDEDRLFVWLPDLETGYFDTAIVDVRTGEMQATDLPRNVWWIFTDPRTEVAYIALADLPDTEASESSEVWAYDTATWTRLPFAVDVSGRVEYVSTTPDRSRVAVTEHFDGEPAYRTTVFDADGSRLAEGLPNANASAMLPDGTVVAGEASRLARFSAETLEPLGSLPTGVFAWSLSASSNGLLLAHGGGPDGVALVDTASNRLVGDTLPGTGLGRSALSPDGTAMVVSGERGVHYWTLQPEDHARAACELVGREPTPAEWRTYFAGLGEQHPVCSED